jgi:diadenosine tetraphosphate (Ap4A) HIT family hydrolase
LKYRNPYYFFLKRDSAKTPEYFVYGIDNTDYVVYQLQDSLTIYRGQKPVRTVLKEASGTIQSSLWNTMVDNNLNPILANDLSEIYAWTIDFFGIQKGDRFRVIYEENYVDSTSIGLGKIYACDFQHMGDDYYAFLDIFPIAKGHTLVITKKEIDYIFDIDDELYQGLFVFAKKVGLAIEKVVPCERMGITVLGLEVPHAHVHVIPINTIYDIDFSKPKLKFSEEEFESLAEEIRSNLK